MAFSGLIAVYLFLGGTSAGCFAVFAVLDLYAEARGSGGPLLPCAAAAGHVSTQLAVARRRMAALVYGATLAMLVAGVLCLLADLGRPDAFYLLFTNPTSSFVTVGSFALTAFAALAAIAFAQAALDLGEKARRAAIVAKAVGIAAAFVVMAYTGLLLESVVAVALWQSAWLPVLFVLSALSCGCAVVLLCACASAGYRGVRSLAKCLGTVDAAVIVLEIVATGAYACSLGVAPDSPFRVLLSGDEAAAFWFGFVGCGMLAPLAIELTSFVTRRGYRIGYVAALGALVLAGGLCLRVVLVLAGVNPAL